MDTEQVSAKIYSFLDKKWCEENITSLNLLSEKSSLTKNDILTIKQEFEVNFVQYQTFDDQSEETVFQLQQVIRELDEIASLIQSASEHECDNFEETVAKKSFNVCSSTVFKKTPNLAESSWSPSHLVGLDFSFSKSYQISPDVRNDGENDAAALSLVYKWKGLRSNIQPLSIPISPKEYNEYLLGALAMFSIFDPIGRGFPINPTDPMSCKEVLDKVEDWPSLGKLILESFGLTSEIVGTTLQAHLSNIAHSSQEIQHDTESLKSVKRRKAEEFTADIWNKKKKAYLKNIGKLSS